MDWPVYFKDSLILSNLKSDTAVVTLWTPMETVQKLVPPDAYSIMGQLYTKKGINYILRNILANPFISKVVLAGNDLMDSGEAFLSFIKNGVDDDYKVIGDDTAHIEPEIKKEALEDFRKRVMLEDLRGAQNLHKIADILSRNKRVEDKDPKLWRKPEMFPDPPVPEILSYPSEFDLVKIRRPTIAEAYVSVLKHVDRFGLESKPVINYVSSSSSKMKELLNLSVVVTDEDPENWHLPDYLPFKKKDLDRYFDGFFNWDRGTEDYTYGERLFSYAKDEMESLKKIYPWLKIGRFKKYFPHGGINQAEISIVRKLKSFPYDKGAIALLGNPFTDVFPQRPPKKIPCLFLIQCQIYLGKLNLTAYFRSNDMYGAWPLNAFALRKLQKNIADELEVKIGPLITISNMAHIYEHDFASVKTLVSEHDSPSCEWDPRGNFVIEVKGTKIMVRLISPDGNKELGSWGIDGTIPKAARELSFLIEKDLAISAIGNAIYLGRQLERAETAVKLSLDFKQDSSLDFDRKVKQHDD